MNAERGVEGGEALEPPSVTLSGVRVRFPRRSHDSLTVDSLSLRRGERVLVLGPSGSGKSTLLNTLAGVVPHTVNATLTGEVVVCGRSTRDTPVVELSRHVAVLGQDPGASVCLPQVEQELALPLENRAVPPDLISGRIDQALASVGASELRPRRSSHLSGGEAQRVALAASLVTRPDVLLLDEPTSMLDASGVTSVRQALESAAEHYAPTIVLVEHRLDDLAGSGGATALPEIALIVDNNGAVAAIGPTPEVLQTHAQELHAAGCWLPLETELYALTGAGEGLRHMANQELLVSMSLTGEEDTAHTSDGGGETVLSARDLSVSRDAVSPTRRRRGKRGKRGKRNGSDAIPVLQEVDLDLRGGEIVALLGANGSGKTTLLLTLARLVPPMSGMVEGSRPGLVFQNPEHQFVAHTVAGEIRHGLHDDRATVTPELLREHRLEHLAESSPYRLSGGEKRRLSIAALLAHDRPALLLDEPTLGLDRRDTISTLAALRETADEGRGVLLASHDLRSVATLADRVVVLAEGRVVADGPVLDVFADAEVLARAQLELPPLVAWLMRHLPSPEAVKRALAALDREVTPARPVPVPAGQARTAGGHR